MADTDETFDPNDLESIDALLDEAELEAAVEEEPADEALDEGAAAEPDPDPLDGLEDMDLEATDDTDDLLDSLEELTPEEPEPEVVAVSEPMAAEEVIEEPPPKPVQKPEPAKADAVPDTDDFLAKRASAQAAQNSNISAADMDAIKKLVIIFGSVLTVLVLTAIGIGVWSALAASSAGMDEETQTLIESIKVGTDQNGALVASSAKSTQDVGKKLDAINFQLTQLTEDLAALEQQSQKAKQEMLDPLGLNKQADKVASPAKAEVKPATPAMVPQMTAAASPELMKKVTSVNSKLIKAQRRIDEVNKRVKQIQSQYKAMMHSVKVVEKQVLLEQAEKAEQAKLAEEKMKKNTYQYNAPDGVFYDQSVSDSYP